MAVLGATEDFAAVNFVKLEFGRFFTRPEVDHRRRVIVLANTPHQALFAKSGIDPIGKKVRVAGNEYTVIGVLGKRPSAGNFNGGQDDFVVIPQTTHQIVFTRNTAQGFAGGNRGSAMIVVVPREGSPPGQALAEIEEIIRIRHGLKLDEANDFDILTQDAALRVWDQVSRATFLALIVISSIALMVGGIGVMAIMMISVTERTREIGVRKALGARRREILVQFLAESIVLTSIGGILGILCGSAIGLTVNLATGFPISLPWWSFALGLGFSATVGIVFGMIPAVRASRLDPIEALRYE
jgi:putative ABC transport system permease protein